MIGPAFFNPAVLWGLAFLAVPVAVHLFNRKRPVLLRFSTTRFFQQSAVEAQRARTIRRILQLIARLLIVALLVAVFAGPYDGRDPFNALSDPRTAVYCWSDPTVSMTLQENGISRSALAAALIDTMDRLLPALTPVFVYRDREGMAMRINGTDGESVAPERFGSAGIRQAFERIFAQSAAGRETPLYVVFSDLQTATVSVLDSMISATRAPLPLVCVDLSPGDVANAGVRSSRAGTVNRGELQTMVYAQGKGIRSHALYAVSAGVRAGQVSVSVPAGGAITAHVPISLSSGNAGGSVILDSPDGFAVDNTDWFTAGRNHRRTGLIVGDPAAVFAVRAALGAAGAGYWDSLLIRSPESVTADDIENASFVVLDNLSYANAALRTLYLSRASGRKSVVLALGTAETSIGFNNEIMAALGSQVQCVVDSSVRPHSIVLPDTLSELWRGFPRLREQDAVVRNRVLGIPGEVLLRMDDGRPLSTALMDKNGSSWVIFASPLGASADNNLCEAGFFVPMVDRISRYALSRSADDGDRWFAGVLHRNPWYGVRGRVQVFTETGALEAVWEQQPMVMFDRPGLYRILPEAEPSVWIAAVIDTAETDLSYREPVVPASRRAMVKVVDGAGFIDLIKNKSDGNISRWLWLCIALFLIAEMLLWERPKGNRNKK